MRADGARYLNAADRLMLVGHDGMRGIGHPGFVCQSQILLESRVDFGALRAAVDRLTLKHPVVSARLRRDEHGLPYWEPTGAPPELQELTIESESDRWRESARLLEAPLDLERESPISFHLLHAPDGRDTLVLRFSHVLMDGKSPEWTLRALDECFDDRAENDAMCDACGPLDAINAHLRRFDRWQRARWAGRVIRSQIGLPVTPVTLAPPEQKEWCVSPFGVLARTIDEAAAAKLSDRVKRICGFPNLTPALAASIFRAISRCTPHPTTDRTVYQTDCPLNLRPPGTREPMFRNFMSFIQICARQGDLADRDEATRRLSAQMRDQLRRGIDVGNLQMMAVMCRFAPLLRSHIITRMKRRPFTLGFSYLGPVIKELTRFCGIPVKNVYTFNTALSPPGVTIQVNQFSGRINLMLSYITSAVPDALAQRLLDEIVNDLGE
ncbi:MAG TPA: hypothetical protein VJZ71_02065 [Phycisphaerae bacterium]|nr:hypothetical protein [Phycisphaerae bacterium]